MMDDNLDDFYEEPYVEPEGVEDEIPTDDQAPEDYQEFKVPEGVEVDQALLTEATPIFKELGLSQDKAQKMVDFYAAKMLPGFLEKQAETWNATQAGWVEGCKTDAEIGGNQFNSAVSDAQLALNTMGTPELKKVFDEYGLGNHPEFVRVFARIGKYLKENPGTGAGGKGTTATTPKDKGTPPAMGKRVMARSMEALAASLYDKS